MGKLLARLGDGFAVQDLSQSHIDTLLDRDRERGTLSPNAREGRRHRSGRLACSLALSRYTGRRIGAICKLHASDVLLCVDVLTRMLGGVRSGPRPREAHAARRDPVAG